VLAVPGAPDLQFADTTSRFIAYVFDNVFVVIAWLVAYVVLDQLGATETAAPYVASLLIDLLYFLAFWTGGRRATPGQRMLNLQVGNAFDGRGLSLSQAVKRWLALGYFISLIAVVPTLEGVATPLLFLWQVILLITTVRSPTKQGFHDRFANTAVVRPIAAPSSGLVKAIVIGVVIVSVGVLVFIVALIFLGSQISSLQQAPR
jgi:uncharacterized RDD family membrane protein YckC